MLRTIIIWVILLTFNISLVSPLQAQILPAAGANLAVVPVFNPALIKGMTIYPENPLMFDFIIHPGDEHLQAEQFKKESQKLIKYFLASLTVPEKDMWVNLSPTEKDRIIPDEFGRTEMGRDLLMQDYFLKKLTASLISPDNEAGKELWEKIYSQTQEKFGTTNIPMDILSKVWIVPESARIYENGKSVFIVDAHLKVLMESEYESEQWTANSELRKTNNKFSQFTVHSPRFTEIIKQILIPAIEHEVNNGPAFANLRQIYNSVILATWYKKNLKQSLLGQVYVDRGKTEGVSHHDPKAKESIYNQYLEAFKKGADAIQEEYDPATQEVITRKYISGGMDLAQLGEKVQGVTELPRSLEGSNNVRVQLGSVDRGKNAGSINPDAAMAVEGRMDQIADEILGDVHKSVWKHKVSLVSPISQTLIDDIALKLNRGGLLEEASQFQKTMKKIPGFFMYDAFADQFIRIHANEYEWFLQMAELAGYPREDLNLEEFAKVELSLSAALQKKYKAELGGAFFNGFVNLSQSYGQFAKMIRQEAVVPKYDNPNLVTFAYMSLSRIAASLLVKHNPLVFGTQDLSQAQQISRKYVYEHDFYHILEGEEFLQTAGFKEFQHPTKIAEYEYISPVFKESTDSALPEIGLGVIPTPSFGGDVSGKSARKHVFAKRKPHQGELINFDGRLYLALSDPYKKDTMIEALEIFISTRYSPVEEEQKILLIDPRDARVRVVLPENDPNYKFQLGGQFILNYEQYHNIPVTLVEAGWGGQMRVVAYEPIHNKRESGLGRSLTISISDANKGALRKISDPAMTASPHDPHISVELEAALPFRIDRPIFTGPHTAAFEKLAKAYRDLVSRPLNERSRNIFKPVVQNVLFLTGMNVSPQDLDDYIEWLQFRELMEFRGEMTQESFKKIKVINEYLLQESVKNGFVFLPGSVLTDFGVLYSSKKFNVVGPIVGINYAPGLSKSGENTGIFTFDVWSFVFNDELAMYLEDFVPKDALFSVVPYRFQTSQGRFTREADETQMVQLTEVDIPLSNQSSQFWSNHDVGHTLTSERIYRGDVRASRLYVRNDFGTSTVGEFTGLQRFNRYMNKIVIHRDIKKELNNVFGQRARERDQFVTWEVSAVGYGFYSQIIHDQDKVEAFQTSLRFLRDSREGQWVNIVPRIFWVYSMLDEMGTGLNVVDRVTLTIYKKALLRIKHWKTVMQWMLDSKALKGILRKVDLDQINRRVYEQIAGFRVDQLPTVSTPEESLQIWKDYVAKQEWGKQVQFTDAAMSAETGFVSKESVLKEAPIQIGEMLKVLEAEEILKPWEINIAMDLIENHRVIYEALGLLNYNYHDFVHSLVVTKVMMLNLQAGQKVTARDWKVGFLAALLHDFHIRSKDKENPTQRTKKQGTVAYVPETIRQIKGLLNMQNVDALPEEHLFETLLNDPDHGPVLQQLAENIRTFLGEDFDGMIHEVLALLLRTHNAYNVAPAPVEYLKKGKAIRATIETEINKKDVKTTDIEKYVKREYKKILAEVKANDEMDTNEKNITETWLKQQEIVELAYLEELNKVEKIRRIENNQWAVILEKVADKGGNYLVDSPEMIENEIMPGLMGEIPITLKGNYKGFIKNELLNEEVLQFISRLPVETKRLFLHNVGHFAAIDGESDEWNATLSVQVEKTLFPKGDAAQMAAPIIEEVLAQQLTDPLIDQGRAVVQPDAEAPGGIDLNPEKIRFDRQGQSVNFNLPSNDTLIQEYLNIQGFEPIIINITPITNIPLLLGTGKPMPAGQALTKI